MMLSTNDNPFSWIASEHLNLVPRGRRRRALNQDKLSLVAVERFDATPSTSPNVRDCRRAKYTTFPMQLFILFVRMLHHATHEAIIAYLRARRLTNSSFLTHQAITRQLVVQAAAHTQCGGRSGICNARKLLCFLGHSIHNRWTKGGSRNATRKEESESKRGFDPFFPSFCSG